MAEAMGLSKVYAGIAVTVFTFVQMVSSFLIPIALNGYNRRHFWLIGCSLIMLMGLILLIFSHGIKLWVSTVLLGIGLGWVTPIFNDVTA